MIACLKGKIKNQYKIANYDNIQKFKTSNSEIHKNWREIRGNMLYTMIQTI